jgi:hypothetical protein
MKKGRIILASTFVLSTVLGLSGCNKQEIQPTLGRVTLAEPANTLPELPNTPRSTSTQTLTPFPIAQPKPEYSPTIDIPKHGRTLLPTSTEASIDPAIVAAQVKSISDALSQGEISVFRDLANEKVGFGLYKSEIWDYYSKSEFLEEINIRIANHPLCLNYEYYTYSFTSELINVGLYVFTNSWDPEWDLGGLRQSDTVVFDLVSHDGLNFVLTGAYLHEYPLPFGDLLCP